MFGSLPSSSRELFLHLQVVERTSLRCFQSEESKVELINSAGGEIPCPGRNCSDNTDVRWYKVKHTHGQDYRFNRGNIQISAKNSDKCALLQGNVSVSELSRDTCVKDGLLHLCEVKGKYDAGVYFCDRRTVEQGVTWTIRRAVEAKVIRKCYVCACIG